MFTLGPEQSDFSPVAFGRSCSFERVAVNEGLWWGSTSVHLGSSRQESRDSLAQTRMSLVEAPDIFAGQGLLRFSGKFLFESFKMCHNEVSWWLEPAGVKDQADGQTRSGRKLASRCKSEA